MELATSKQIYMIIKVKYEEIMQLLEADNLTIFYISLSFKMKDRR